MDTDSHKVKVIRIRKRVIEWLEKKKIKGKINESESMNKGVLCGKNKLLFVVKNIIVVEIIWGH